MSQRMRKLMKKNQQNNKIGMQKSLMKNKMANKASKHFVVVGTKLITKFKWLTLLRIYSKLSVILRQ